MSTTGENEQPRAAMTPPDAQASAGGATQELEWQSELDSVMNALDTKMSHPRRRASDAVQSMLPELGPVEITGELLDEISWRVAQHLRRSPPAVVGLEGVPPDAMAPAPAVDTEHSQMPGHIAVSIRVRRPLFRFRWRFWRQSRRRRAMITFADYRIG
jgi:hypothetical protein